MPAVGSVNVKISATTLGLVSGLAVASKSLQSFGAGVSKIGGGVAGLAAKFAPLAAAAAAVAGVAGLGGMVSSSLQTIDAQSKMAKTLGMSTESLIGLQYAGDLSGVSMESMNSALLRLSRKGIDLAGLADQMAAIESPAERTKLAFDVLGKSGAEMIPLLSEGGDAIRRMAEEGAKLKGVSGVDAASIETANDAVSRLQASFVGIANSVAVMIAPALKMFADSFAEVGIAGRSAFETMTPIITAFGSTLLAYGQAAASLWSSVFTSLSEMTGITFASIGTTIIDTLLGAEFAFQNAGEIATVVWDSIKLGALQTFGVISHFWTAQLPGYLTWFSTNWRDVFATAFDYATTVFINLGTNIRNVFSALFKWIKSGFTGAFEIDWKPLTEGAVNSLKSMPDIPARAITALEKELGSKISTASTDLGERFAEQMIKRRAELLTKAAPVDLKTKLDFGAVDAVQAATAKTKGPGALESVGAVQRGSSEAVSAIFKAMRGDDIQGKMLDAATKTSKDQAKATIYLKEIASRETVELVARGDI